MKLRQKLAVVLASAMVITSVPVVTVAASTNNITTGTVLVQEDTSFASSTTAPAVSVKFDSFNGAEVFYLTLENAEWAAGISAAGYTGVTDMASGAAAAWSVTGAKMTRVSDTTVKVEVSAPYAAGQTLNIPLLTTSIKGEAKVNLKTMSSGSTVSEGSWVFATTTDEISTVEVKSATAITREGKIADIVFTEAFKGSIPSATTTADKFALVELDDTDFQFQLGTPADANTYNLTLGTDSEVNGFAVAAAGTTGKYKKYTLTNVAFGYGFAGATETINVYARDDKSAMYVELHSSKASDSLGTITLKGMVVKSTEKNPAAAELKANISGHVVAKSGLVVAKVTTYSTTLSVKDDKAVDIIAGQEKEVEFTLEETVEDSLTKDRYVTFTIDNGYFANEVEDDKDATLAALKAAIVSMSHKEGSDTDATLTSAQLVALIDDVVIENEKVVGFEMKIPANVTTKLDSYVIKAKVRVGLEQSGAITLKAEGRAMADTATVVIANGKTAVEVTSEKAVLKTGLKDQVAGKITIKESDKAMIKYGQELVVTLPVEDGITLSTAKDEKPVVKVLGGDIQVGDVNVINTTDADGKNIQQLKVEIKRASKEASTIEISNFQFDTDRTVAEGSYDVKLAGKALTELNDSFTIKDFITIGTPNTEDLVAANGLAKGVSSFIIGESKYTVNGVEKAMDAQSFIQDPGFTMVPMRYVAEAFGVKGSDILFSKGVTTIFAGSRTIQLTNGSNIAIVNGVKVQMATKVTIKNGRTYAPIGEVAQLLGVAKAWDNTAKTATFTNK